jgi:hypothetical protein
MSAISATRSPRTPDARAGLLGRILPTEPDSPRAWVLVFAAFLSMFTSFAVAYSFGAFVNPITVEFHSGHAAISAIFSITAFVYFLFGAAAGHISDRVGPRPMMAASALFMGLGLILTSDGQRVVRPAAQHGAGRRGLRHRLRYDRGCAAGREVHPALRMARHL